MEVEILEGALHELLRQYSKLAERTMEYFHIYPELEKVFHCRICAGVGVVGVGTAPEDYHTIISMCHAAAEVANKWREEEDKEDESSERANV